MAYTPPVVFTANTALTAADLKSSNDDLRVYLHKGIVQADLEATQWVETRHIQPPVVEPYSGIQHGVTGHQGGYGAAQEGVRLSFVTNYLTGGGLLDNRGKEWHEIPNTAFKVQVRRAAKLLFHWHVEMEAGPDNVPFTTGRNIIDADRLTYVSPYFGKFNPDNVERRLSQEIQNHQEGWAGAYPIGATRTYPVCGAYGQRHGVYAVDSVALGETIVGLAGYSQVDRTAIVNWNVAIEVFYL